MRGFHKRLLGRSMLVMQLEAKQARVDSVLQRLSGFQGSATGHADGGES
jgi:hypothetical protein